MSHDPAKAVEVREWLTRAEADLRAASVLLRADPPLLPAALFHCQQAAEKSMKALLVWNDVVFRRTHDLGEIGRQCTALDPTIEPLCRRADELTVFAWIFRYPGSPDTPDHSEATDALALAQDVVNTVLSRLPADVRP